MNWVDYAAKEIYREIGRRSREFYEFVMPAIDMYEDATGLVVKIDLPGFKRDEISISVNEDVLTINARKGDTENLGRERTPGTMLSEQRPLKINKRVLLPSSYSARKGEPITGMGTYSEGVVTLKIPATRIGNIPIT
jgi:HSP20 family protein